MMADKLGLFNAPSTILRASAPSVLPNPQLGPLTELPGTWVGSGFTVIWLPVYQGNPNFRLKLNATSETLTTMKIGADIPNRGSIQPDLHFLGVHYLQLVSDAATHGQLHIEPGMWLNLPPGPANPNPNESFVARLASIPHGNALLAQGRTYQRVKPSIPIENTMPGPPVPPEAPGMLNNAVLPSGIPPGSARNPNRVLWKAISGQKITRTVVLEIATDFATQPPSGGINNIAYIERNANATRMSATFWIETVRQRDGSLTLQLQYSQKVILSFDGIDWPHVSVATLVQQ
jgi:hypothetical protein